LQGALQLLGEGLAVAHAAFVQQADGGDVGESLADADGGGVEGARGGPEQVQGADDLLPQPHRQGLHGGEPGVAGGCGEPWPVTRLGGEIGSGDGLAGPEAVQAGPLVALQLEQLEQPGGLAGGGHHAQFTARVGQQQPGRGDVQQLDAAAGQRVQEVHHVEPGDHGVGKLDERF
jgi:hypothetical protein